MVSGEGAHGTPDPQTGRRQTRVPPKKPSLRRSDAEKPKWSPRRSVRDTESEPTRRCRAKTEVAAGSAFRGRADEWSRGRGGERPKLEHPGAGAPELPPAGGELPHCEESVILAESGGPS